MPFGRPTPRDDERASAYRDWIQQRHPLAIASIVLGIFSMLEFGTIPVFSLAAIVLGILALKSSPPEKGPENGPLLGRRLAVTGIVLGTISVAIFIYIRTLPTGH